MYYYNRQNKLLVESKQKQCRIIHDSNHLGINLQGILLAHLYKDIVSYVSAGVATILATILIHKYYIDLTRDEGTKTAILD